jgi:hypothetical protein
LVCSLLGFPAPKVASARPPRVASEVPTAPAPDVRLTVEAPGPARLWTMRVENAGAVPVQIAADARWLSLLIDPGDGRKPQTCVLPTDMRPLTVGDRALVLPPGRAFVETFDPRLYCFAAQQAAVVVPGATVIPSLGFSEARRGGRSARAPSPPFAVAPLDGIEPKVAATKLVIGGAARVGTAQTDASEPKGDASPGTPAAGATRDAAPPSSGGNAGGAAASGAPREAIERSFEPTLVVSLPDRRDAGNGRNITVAVTVRNEGNAPATLLLRPNTLAFEVSGPMGDVVCPAAGASGAIRELFTTLRPGQRAAATTTLDGTCPRGTFDEDGLYDVRAIVDTRGLTGDSFGGRAIGEAVRSDRTMLLRVRRPKTERERRRPKIEASGPSAGPSAPPG